MASLRVVDAETELRALADDAWPDARTPMAFTRAVGSSNAAPRAHDIIQVREKRARAAHGRPASSNHASLPRSARARARAGA